jgi:hypothetical protein
MQSVPITRASNRNFARRKKTASGPQGQTETSLKIEDLTSNKTTGNLLYDQQPGFRILREFYVIIFLNKLIIVENIPKNEQIKIKRLWLRLWGPSVNHGPFLGSPGPEPMYRLNPPLIGPAYHH